MQSATKLDSSSVNLEQMTREVVRRLLEASNGHGVTQEIQRRNGVLELQVPIGVSVRHVHLCPEHVRILFGEGYDLHIYNELYQKGYYAAKEQVMVVGRKRCIEKISRLGADAGLFPGRAGAERCPGRRAQTAGCHRRSRPRHPAGYHRRA